MAPGQRRPKPGPCPRAALPPLPPPPAPAPPGPAPRRAPPPRPGPGPPAAGPGGFGPDRQEPPQAAAGLPPPLPGLAAVVDDGVQPSHPGESPVRPVPSVPPGSWWDGDRAHDAGGLRSSGTAAAATLGGLLTATGTEPAPAALLLRRHRCARGQPSPARGLGRHRARTTPSGAAAADLSRRGSRPAEPAPTRNRAPLPRLLSAVAGKQHAQPLRPLPARPLMLISPALHIPSQRPAPLSLAPG